jgi:hypothetical protein
MAEEAAGLTRAATGGSSSTDMSQLLEAVVAFAMAESALSNLIGSLQQQNVALRTWTRVSLCSTAQTLAAGIRHAVLG